MALAIAASLHKEEWLYDVQSISVGNDIVLAGRIRKD